METFLSWDHVEALMQPQEGLCVSLYMPTHRTGRDVREDPIRYKNLVNRAEEMLKERGLRSSQVQAMLQPALVLETKSDFWEHQSNGLAVFITESDFRYYHCPVSFEEVVVVAPRFYLKPLLAVVSTDQQFYLLALRKRDVQLFQGSRQGLSPIMLRHIPSSIDEILQRHHIEPQPQIHTRTPHNRTGKQAGYFYGQIGGEEIVKKELLQYLREVDKGVLERLKTERAPLVVACEDHLFGLFQEVNRYPYLHPEHVPGNPTHMTQMELHAKAWALMEPYYLDVLNKARERYFLFKKEGRASHHIREIVPQSYLGKIDLLLAAADSHVWGRFDPQTLEVVIHETQHAEDEDLLDTAAFHSLLHRGEVFILKREEIPDDGMAAAGLRK